MRQVLRRREEVLEPQGVMRTRETTEMREGICIRVTLVAAYANPHGGETSCMRLLRTTLQRGEEPGGP